MKAAFVSETGPADQVQFGDLPDPTPSSGEILVQLEATAVNPIDTYIRSGVVAMELPLPYIPGCDFCGEVFEVGPNVSRFQVGDRVWGSNQGLFGRQGASSEKVAVPEDFAYPLPESVSAKQAAAGALVSITAGLGLYLHADLQSGETLFINGGSGGVGAVVVQMAKALGVRVLTTAGSEEKIDYCRSIGADVVFDYRSSDLDQQIQSEVEANGKIDLWWETLRSPDIARTIPWMNKRGRIIVMAGRESELLFPLGPFYVNDLRLIGFAMFNASADEQRSVAERVNELYISGKLTIPIGKELTLSELGQAHQLQELKTLESAADFRGKIVLTP